MQKIAVPIGLGTAAIGRPQYINIRQMKAAVFSMESFMQSGIGVLEAAYQKGVRYFDTAPGYGLAEQMLIDWVREKDDADIEVATKWGYTYVANYNPKAKIHELKEHSLDKLNQQWSKSKTLLPWLTTYQIHSASLETGVLSDERILHRLAQLKADHGLLIGITTTGVNQVEVLKRALDIEVDEKPLFNVFQVTYNLFDQSLADVSSSVFSQHGRLVIKEALANGRVFPNKDCPHYTSAYRTLLELAQKYRVGIDAIALRFCIDSIGAYKVLSGAAHPRQMVENLQSLTFRLESVDLEVLQSMAIDPDFYWQERKQLAWN
jgi:aryl-alcohol dehydrogenase-like predicted oxidoreductase